MFCDDFECGYINKPYCSLRPFNNIPSCPKFSCPPPLRCQQPFNSRFDNRNRCFDGCNPYPYCCPRYDYCQPSFPYDPCCEPCRPCRPRPCCFPLNNLLWFFGGFKCGNRGGDRRRDRCNERNFERREKYCDKPNFFKNFLNEKIK